MHRTTAYNLAALVAIAVGVVWLTGCHSGSGGGEKPTVVERTIGPGGGTVTSGDGRLTLTFPPGALPADNTIVIETLDPDNPPAPFAGMGGIDAAYDLRPDGLSFEEPVTATFNVGDDPTPGDGSIRFPLAMLATQGSDGQPETLANLVANVDPETGLTRVTGELNHFTPLVAVATGVPVTLAVLGVPDRSLTTDKTFTASTQVNFDTGRSDLISTLENARYTDRSFDPIVCQLQDCEEVPLQMTGPTDFGSDQFSIDIDYGCSALGTGRYAADVELDATAADGTTFQMRLEVERLPLECIAPDAGGDGDGDDDGGEVGFEFQHAAYVPQTMPGMPVVLPADFDYFDMSWPSRPGEPPYQPEFLVAALSGNGTLYGYDDQLARKDSVALGLDLRFASGWWRAPGTLVDDNRDGMFLGGTDGLYFLYRNDADFRLTEPLDTTGNFTDIQVGNPDGSDGEPYAAGVNFTQGFINIYRADPATGLPVRDDINSGLINNAAVGGHFLGSAHVPDTGFDEPGDMVLVLTTRGPNDEPGKIYGCTRTEDSDGQPAADCTEGPVVGANAQHLRCAEPDAAGDTVCAAPAFGDQTVLILGWNIFGGPIVPIATLDNAQTVTPAVQRDGEDVIVVATDADEDAVVAAKVHPDHQVETTREPIPPVDPGNGGESIQARRPVHVIDPLDQVIGFLFSNEASDAPDAGTLLLGSILGLGAGD